MRIAKELATLLTSEAFRGLNISQREIITEAAKCLLSSTAFIDAAKICADQFTLDHIIDASATMYAQSLQDVFGTPWPDPSTKLVPLEMKEEAPSD